MSENTGTDTAVDPLSADVGDKELTKLPLLPGDRIMRFEIRKPTIAMAKKKGSENRVLTIPCHTVEDQVGVDGKTMNKGWPIFKRIVVTPGPKRDAQRIAGDVARLCQACGVRGVRVIDVIDNPVTHLEGKLFDGKTRIVPESDGFPESNDINPIPLAQ